MFVLIDVENALFTVGSSGTTEGARRPTGLGAHVGAAYVASRCNFMLLSGPGNIPSTSFSKKKSSKSGISTMARVLAYCVPS